jgi:gliding motility-associated lipoprotein GldH
MITRTIRKNKLLFALTALLFFTSCNKNVVYSEYKKFDDQQWAANNKAVFDLDITDTLTLNNVSLMIRHSDTYPYNNLFLFVTSKYPDGMVKKDTMEVILANEKGEWAGSGAGDIYDVKIPIKRNVRFPLAGKYQFVFEQGMRVDPLPMIMDFGFEIEKVK